MGHINKIVKDWVVVEKSKIKQNEANYTLSVFLLVEMQIYRYFHSRYCYCVELFYNYFIVR